MLTFSGKRAGNVMGENELDCSAILLGQEFNMLLDLNKILIGPTTFPSTASRWGRAQFDYY